MSPPNKKGPAGADRRTFLHIFKYRILIVACPDPEPPYALRDLAGVYHDALHSDDIRVTKLGVQILWKKLRELLHLRGGDMEARA
jgi:hypothetical protein